MAPAILCRAPSETIKREIPFARNKFLRFQFPLFLSFFLCRSFFPWVLSLSLFLSFSLLFFFVFISLSVLLFVCRSVSSPAIHSFVLIRRNWVSSHLRVNEHETYFQKAREYVNDIAQLASIIICRSIDRKSSYDGVEEYFGIATIFVRVLDFDMTRSRYCELSICNTSLRS